MFEPTQHIHFVGVGGVGMCGIAEVMLRLGYHVSGSDLRESETLDRLRELGATIHVGHNAAHVENVHLVVVSTAITTTNVEVNAAVAKKIPVVHRAEVLGDLMRLKHGLLVCGTHGKTTTTSILSTVLHETGLDPTVIIGGRVNAIGSHARFGKGHLFLAEADESDGSFLRLNPTVAVVTNIDNDHLDHYKDFAEIVETFQHFLDKVPFFGSVCACIDDLGVRQVLPTLNKPIVTYGLEGEPHITARGIVFDAFSTTFTPVLFGRSIAPVTLKMPGRYNIQNALASFAVAHVLKLNLELVAKAVSQFDGVEHRFTIVGKTFRKHSITIVDDYAHNPTKIRAVLSGIKEGQAKTKVCAIFQPHRYSRVSSMMDDFASSFINADYVIVTPIYSAGENPIDGATQEFLAKRIEVDSHKQSTVVLAADLVEAAQLACQYARKFEVTDNVIVISLGAGDVKRVGPLVLRNIEHENLNL